MVKPLLCWNCGNSLEDVPLPISRHANCSACYEVLHCCRMCIHYAPSKQGQCDHDRADPPVTKESGNFCEYFKPAKNAYKPGSNNRTDAAKSRLADLFGDNSDAKEEQDSEKLKPEDDLRSKFDDLFDN